MGGLKPPNPTLATPLPPTVQLTVTTDTGMKGETVETAAKLQSVHDPAAPLNDTVQRSNSHCITEGSEHWFIICTPTWTHHYCFQYIRLLTTKCNIEMLCLLLVNYCCCCCCCSYYYYYYVSRHSQLRTGGFSKVLLPACSCWRQLAHSNLAEDAIVLVSSVICTICVPSAFIDNKWLK